MNKLDSYNSSKVQYISGSSEVNKMLEFLDEEINIKCNELKEKRSKKFLMRALLNECLAIPGAVIHRVFFKATLLHFALAIIVIEIISLILCVPLFFDNKY